MALGNRGNLNFDRTDWKVWRRPLTRWEEHLEGPVSLCGRRGVNGGAVGVHHQSVKVVTQRWRRRAGGGAATELCRRLVAGAPLAILFDPLAAGRAAVGSGGGVACLRTMRRPVRESVESHFVSPAARGVPLGFARCRRISVRIRVACPETSRAAGVGGSWKVELVWVGIRVRR